MFFTKKRLVLIFTIVLLFGVGMCVDSSRPHLKVSTTMEMNKTIHSIVKTSSDFQQNQRQNLAFELEDENEKIFVSFAEKKGNLFHTVKSGDSLWKIVRHYYSYRQNKVIQKGVLAIMGANPHLTNINRLNINMRIFIPLENQIGMYYKKYTKQK